MGTVLGACRITDETPGHNDSRAVQGAGRDAGACPQIYPRKLWKTHFARHYGEEDQRARGETCQRLQHYILMWHNPLAQHEGTT
jgi:hypothetical protein